MATNAPVLSTLNDDGSRRWLRPRLSRGRFLNARRAVGYSLILLFAALPFVRVGGKPSLLLDVAHREFTFFGTTFLPTDTALLALLLVGLFLFVFLLTAVAGRVWCGYGCPQTVYLELLYRPLERLFDGPPRAHGAPGSRRSGARTIAKYVLFLLASAAVANLFLAYFVGVDTLKAWMTRSPFEQPASFLVMGATTALMFFDFAYFREQMCVVACPYGRLQSVLLDRESLIVGYDAARGEPRGKKQPAGDCIDCGLCVDTCPTGIDIREGLKMECVGCAQCIDACDAVMDKLGRARGLVRYDTQAGLAGNPVKLRWLRPRVLVYLLALAMVVALFSVLASRAKGANVLLLRGPGAPFTELSGGEVSNSVRLEITNRGGTSAQYQVQVVAGLPGRLLLDENPVRVPAGGAVSKSLLLIAPANAFGPSGKLDLRLSVSDGRDFSTELPFRLLGPAP